MLRPAGIERPEFISSAKINGGKRIVGIEQATRNKIADIIARGISDGQSQISLRESIQDAMGATKARAKLIAKVFTSLNEKRAARKEDGEELPEGITIDEIRSEVTAIIEGMGGPGTVKQTERKYANEIIELLYPATVIYSLGARRLGMANGNLNIPKIKTGLRHDESFAVATKVSVPV